MATVTVNSRSGSVINAGVTTYGTYGHGNSGNPSTTESAAQNTIHYAGSITNLWVHLSANTLSVGSNTIRLRKNTGNGNNNVTIGAGTGEVSVEDTGSTDTIAANDVLDLQFITSAGTGSMTPQSIGTLFNCTTNTTITLVSARPSGRAFSAAGVQNFPDFASGLNTGGVEAEQSVKARSACTLANLSVGVTSNTRADSTLSRSRKNAGNGNQLVTILSSDANVMKQDTGNTDSVAVNDTFTKDLTVGAGAGTLTLAIHSIDCTTTDKSYPVSGNPIAATAASTTAYFSTTVQGQIGTETFASVKVGYTVTAANLAVYIATNGLTNTATWKFRKNAGNGNQNISILSTDANVLKEDTGNTDSLVSTDLICYQLVTAAGGTSIQIRQMNLWLTVPTVSTGNYNFFMVM